MAQDEVVICMVTTRPPKTIVKPTALGPVANTDTKLLICGLFQEGRVLAQDGGDISDRLQESLRVVPMHPLEGGELDVLRTTPGPASTGHLGLVEADDGCSQSVIVRVASAADGRLNTRLGEPLGVTDRDVLHAAIAVMHQWIFWV